MAHTVLIALHTAAAILALLAGAVALRRTWPFDIYLWSLVATVVLLAATVGVDWAGLATTSRAIFSAFTVLGGYMIWRGVQARRLLARPSGGRSPRYLDHLGFTLVALTDAFLVIAVLTLGAPAWAIAVIGALAAAAGHRTLAALKRRLTSGGPLPRLKSPGGLRLGHVVDPPVRLVSRGRAHADKGTRVGGAARPGEARRAQLAAWSRRLRGLDDLPDPSAADLPGDRLQPVPGVEGGDRDHQRASCSSG